MTAGDDRLHYEAGHDAGVEAGKILERLSGHDKHFATINGSVERVADRLAELGLQVQRLADQAVSRDATVLTTAAALKDAEDARRDKGDQKWSPTARALTVVSVLVAVAGLIFVVLSR